MIKYDTINKNLRNRLEVDIASQTLNFFLNDQKIKSYLVSTAKNGIGNVIGSGCTASGWHLITQMYGYKEPVGMIFKSRKATGQIAEIYYDQAKRSTDFVTTRIIRLKGLEPKINGNSFRRYIYIHGTPEEGLIGTPVSHGCIRMKNNDIIELFDLVNCGMVVNIQNNIGGNS